jgi:hypothetical protein
VINPGTPAWSARPRSTLLGPWNQAYLLSRHSCSTLARAFALAFH